MEKPGLLTRTMPALTGGFESRQHEDPPEYLRSDNGPEFIAKAIQRWLRERQVKTHSIEPGSPWQNAYGESFNGKFRDECLNMEVFYSLAEAQMIVEIWRQSYNNERPHSSLGYQTPAAFAAALRLLSGTMEQLPQHRRPCSVRVTRGCQ